MLVSAPLYAGFRGQLPEGELPPPAPGGYQLAAPAEARQALEEFLTRSRGVPSPIASMLRITAGHSRAMWRVALADGPSLVVRVEQGGVFGTSGTDEARVMRALKSAAFPVAAVLWEEQTGSVLGQPFFVMEDLGPSDPTPDGTERSLAAPDAVALVQLLARLHRLPAEVVGDAEPDGGTPGEVRRWADVYRASSGQIPLLDEAEAWLLCHAPRVARLAPVHGDAGPGNFIHRGGKAIGLTDFEFIHLGDPAEDWVFCAAMRGSRTMSRQAWEELFAAEAGVQLDAAAWRYWEAFNLFKGACANLSAGAAFNATTPAPNLLSVGTAAHQMFLRRLADLVAGDHAVS
jgi:aminoglycoside phosphotransferase (APT) family kinase protein